ncbi:hypothetical protein KM915_11970 [Cytobacillus oceanisediminis]|uniref:hypothetical protein n=1 Tax=Cytobacillus oceanisediminis TaxID=665099 RepID=UPI001C219505|nr:hypothetical protein [Cytobacillus oceanisediminis]MBU8730769.1 hypothetical protein [Cytobacillus oceanisediminis]
MNISVEITDHLPDNGSVAIGDVIFTKTDFSEALEGIDLCKDKDQGRYYLKCTAKQYNVLNRLGHEINNAIIHEFVTMHIEFMKTLVIVMEEDELGRKILDIIRKKV